MRPFGDRSTCRGNEYMYISYICSLCVYLITHAHLPHTQQPGLPTSSTTLTIPRMRDRSSIIGTMTTPAPFAMVATVASYLVGVEGHGFQMAPISRTYLRSQAFNDGWEEKVARARSGDDLPPSAVVSDVSPLLMYWPGCAPTRLCCFISWSYISVSSADLQPPVLLVTKMVLLPEGYL